MGNKKYNISKDFSKSSMLLNFFNFQKNPTPKKTESKKVAIKSYDGAFLDSVLIQPKNVKDVLPCLVYFHGGSFKFHALRGVHRLVHKYAYGAKCKVLLVNYRLLPKYRFPVPPQDSYSALQWITENASVLGIDANRIAVGGDSCGGNLATVVSQMSRDRSGPKICFQMLIYPGVDCDAQTESMREFVDTPVLNSKTRQETWKNYLSDGDFGMLSYAAPIKAKSFAGLPPAYVETAEFDCIRDEAIDYALRLQEAGVKTELFQTKQTVHGFDVLFRNSKITQKSLDRRILALKIAFK
jgi:acetyl esterase